MGNNGEAGIASSLLAAYSHAANDYHPSLRIDHIRNFSFNAKRWPRAPSNHRRRRRPH